MSVTTQIHIGTVRWLFATCDAWLAEVAFLIVDVVEVQGNTRRFNRGRGEALVGSSGVSLLGHSYDTRAPNASLDGRLRNELSLAVAKKACAMFAWSSAAASIAERIVRSHDPIDDDAIRSSGLGDPEVCETSPRMVAWLQAQGYDPAVVSESIQASIMPHDHVITTLANLVGRPVRVVLDEMANTPEEQSM